MRSGFVAVAGRTGVGKSTLVNSIVGTKVSITSPHPNTTRSLVQGVLTRDDAQAVFVDTPGFHKPRTRLGERLNDSAGVGVAGADVILMVIDATAPIGTGDEWVADRLKSRPHVVCVVNRIDRARRPDVVTALARAGEWGFDEYFAVSAMTGQGVGDMVDTVLAFLPEGPKYFPDDSFCDTPDAVWVAELVREALLQEVHDELPHSIACRVTDWDGSYIRCEVAVERESQKPIVIGRNGSRLRRAGEVARSALPDGSFLDLVVRVEKGWQGSDDQIDRFGYGTDDA